MKNVAKLILLAQTASDSGKGILIGPETSNRKNAIGWGYGLKDLYLRQAVAASKGTNIKASYAKGVVYFDTPWGQVSFHSFSEEWKTSNLPPGRWTGRYGESRATCSAMARKFNLPHYGR